MPEAFTSTGVEGSLVLPQLQVMNELLLQQVLQPIIYPFNKGLIALSLYSEGVAHRAMHIGRTIHDDRAYDIWFIEFAAKKDDPNLKPQLYCCYRQDPNYEDAESFCIDVIGFRRIDIQEAAMNREENPLTVSQVQIALRGLDMLDLWAGRDCSLIATYKIKTGS